MDKKEIVNDGEQSLESLVRMVCVVKDRKFVPYGTTAITGGKPVYFFDTYADYEAAAPMLPEECMFITLDDIDTGGFEFDSELSETSENAPQTKVVTAALRKKASFDSLGVVQFTDSETVTERDSGLGLSAIEKNAAVSGTLANFVAEAKTQAQSVENQIGGIQEIPSAPPFAYSTYEQFFADITNYVEGKGISGTFFFTGRLEGISAYNAFFTRNGSFTTGFAMLFKQAFYILKTGGSVFGFRIDMTQS